MEISILQKLSVHLQEEKTHIPMYLKYRDEGYMYFPIPEMLPLLKAVDVKTKEYVSNFYSTMEVSEVTMFQTQSMTLGVLSLLWTKIFFQKPVLELF